MFDGAPDASERFALSGALERDAERAAIQAVGRSEQARQLGRREFDASVLPPRA